LFIFGGGGGSFAVGSFTAGASVFGATAGASVFGATAGASVFGARVWAGFTSAGAFFSGPFFFGGCDSSGVGCWAITAPASASEQTISKLVIFFMVALCLVVDAGDLFNPGPFSLPAMLRIAMQAGARMEPRSPDGYIVRACLRIRFPAHLRYLRDLL
jgi:hypothetical protein